MSSTVHAFDFLMQPGKHAAAAVCVVFGGERFLARLALDRLRRQVLGDEDDDIPFATFDGGAASWRDVRDELSTVSLFGPGKRLVLVDDADALVSAHRDQIEDYLQAPRSGSVLILVVDKWQANTRLYKRVDAEQLAVDCRLPKAGRRDDAIDESRVLKWLAWWAKGRHHVELARGTGEALLDMVGPELGLLDQELAKLALLVEPGGAITPKLVRESAGGWRTKTAWEMLDAAADGDAPAALAQLDRLLRAGEHPVAILGPAAWYFRRFATATRIIEHEERLGHKVRFAEVLARAGFRKFPADQLRQAERRLRQLGRVRAGRLYRWLLEADVALKGSHSSADRARFVLERLLVRLSKAAAPPRPKPVR